MYEKTTNRIKVSVKPFYLEEQSEPSDMSPSFRPCRANESQPSLVTAA